MITDIDRYRAWLLDLDGTLVDSAPDLHGALTATLARHGLPCVDEALVRRNVGHGARRLIEYALGELEPTRPLSDFDVDRLHRAFLDHYECHIADRSRPYPGVRETLEALRARGVALACVTNKYEGLSRDLLRALDLADFFAAVVGGDTLPERKPDPAPLFEACRQLATDVEAALMVGDSITDVRAARAAGMPVICVSYGYNHGEDIHGAGPDRVVDSLLTLI